MSLTIDASVFVAGIRTQEPHHAESREFFRQLIVRDIGVICPTIVLTETVAASARRGADAALIIHGAQSRS